MAIERFLNEQAWNRLMQLIDDLGAVDLDELTARMDTIEGTVNAAVATANAASQQAQNAANISTAMGNRVTDLETLTTDQGRDIRTLQAVSNEHTTDISALKTFNEVSSDTYTINGVSFIFRKIGKTVIVISYGTPTNPITASGYAGSATIANKYRPAAAVIANVQATAAIAMQINIGANGNFQYGYSAEEISGTNIRCLFSYLSNN